MLLRWLLVSNQIADCRWIDVQITFFCRALFTSNVTEGFTYTHRTAPKPTLNPQGRQGKLPVKVTGKRLERLKGSLSSGSNSRIISTTVDQSLQVATDASAKQPSRRLDEQKFYLIPNSTKVNLKLSLGCNSCI